MNNGSLPHIFSAEGGIAWQEFGEKRKVDLVCCLFL